MGCWGVAGPEGEPEALRGNRGPWPAAGCGGGPRAAGARLFPGPAVFEPAPGGVRVLSPRCVSPSCEAGPAGGSGQGGWRAVC